MSRRYFHYEGKEPSGLRRDGMLRLVLSICAVLGVSADAQPKNARISVT
jgi:hypothetical protein